MTRINLLPWRSEQRKTLTLQFLYFTITALLITSIIMMLIRNTIENAIDLQKKNNAYLKIETTQKNIIISRINAVQTLQKKQTEDVRLFDELTKIVPNSINLTLIKREGNKITLHGKEESNTDISQLMRQIEKSHLFSQPQLQEIKMNTFILQIRHESTKN
jgi:type IV pilus assembly protein PilN